MRTKQSLVEVETFSRSLVTFSRISFCLILSDSLCFYLDF